MCADGWDTNAPKGKLLVCPSCGEDVDEDGIALTGCHYSPVDCDTCGSAPCDESC